MSSLNEEQMAYLKEIELVFLIEIDKSLVYQLADLRGVCSGPIRDKYSEIIREERSKLYEKAIDLLTSAKQEQTEFDVAFLKLHTDHIAMLHDYILEKLDISDENKALMIRAMLTNNITEIARLHEIVPVSTYQCLQDCISWCRTGTLLSLATIYSAVVRDTVIAMFELNGEQPTDVTTRYMELTDSELAYLVGRENLARELSPRGRIRPFKIDPDQEGWGGDTGYPTMDKFCAAIDDFIEQHPDLSLLETYKQFEQYGAHVREYVQKQYLTYDEMSNHPLPIDWKPIDWDNIDLTKL